MLGRKGGSLVSRKVVNGGRDAFCGQVFPDKSLSTIPVKTFRGVSNAWEMDTRFLFLCC